MYQRYWKTMFWVHATVPMIWVDLWVYESSTPGTSMMEYLERHIIAAHTSLHVCNLFYLSPGNVSAINVTTNRRHSLMWTASTPEQCYILILLVMIMDLPFHKSLHFYRPRSRGDNTFGSVRLFVCLYVCMSELSCLNRLTYDLNFSSQGAFKMVGRSKWLLFSQVAPSWSITLLIFFIIWEVKQSGPGKCIECG